MVGFFVCFLSVYIDTYIQWGFPGSSVVKNPLAKQETWVQSLGPEDPLEEEISSLLAWEISWTEEPGRLVRGLTKSRTRLRA